jgi:translation initiation factor IF-2
MPVRIYDLAKKLGLESKEVIAKAKELGISAAKVPSSSLDKITAEYLEQHLTPKILAPVPAPVAVPPPTPTLPPPPPAPIPELITTTKTELATTPIPELPAQEPPAPPVTITTAPEIQQPPAVVEIPEIQTPAVPPEAAVPPALEVIPPTVPEVIEVKAPLPPPPPPAPAGPQVGDKIGFIALPPKPGAKPAEKPGAAKTPQKQPEVRRPGDFRRGPEQARPGGFQARPGQMQQQQGRFQQQGFQQRRPGFVPGKEAPKPAAPTEAKFVPPTTGELISMKPPIIVRDLADRLNKKPFQLIADLMALNFFATVNQAIDEVAAQKICAKYGFRFEVEKRDRGGGTIHAPIRKMEEEVEDKAEDLKPRPPVVTIMGHVDHGKTTLLDVIRKANVAAGEAGGITQHIGAYTISIPHPDRPKDLQQITFLDTPGHAAFSAMRARGANVTDIVILVVAANDGVMPQTLEALSHAQAAKVPIIVAVNKIDHPNANAMRVRQQLQEKGLVPEEWGGPTIYQDVSALTKQNIDKLLGILVLQSEIMELKANPTRAAKGNIIESGLEPGGPTATVLVRKGTLKISDTILCGSFFGRVRALISEDGKRLKEAPPSHAVKVLGLNGVPEAGLEFAVVENEKNARELAEERGLAMKALEAERRPKITLENLFDTLASEANKVLRVVVKADTQGSVEAIVDALKKIESDKVSLEVIHSAVGTITESDVVLASASKAIVLGFHTRVDNGVTDVAKREGVQIKLYAIIYELIDQVKEAMAGLLDPLIKEVTIGQAEVRKVFTLSKGGNVAGCVVTNGRIVKGKMRVVRRKGTIYEGVSLTLRRFQDDVNEVRAGMECGIRLDGFDDFQAGDFVECYTLEKVPQKL